MMSWVKFEDFIHGKDCRVDGVKYDDKLDGYMALSIKCDGKTFHLSVAVDDVEIKVSEVKNVGVI